MTSPHRTDCQVAGLASGNECPAQAVAAGDQAALRIPATGGHHLENHPDDGVTRIC